MPYRQIISAAQMLAAIPTMARDIAEKFPGRIGDCALVGLYYQGVPLAEKLRDALTDITGETPNFGKLDITMYRDDIGNRSRLPMIRETVIPFDVNGREIILVDDVLSTGRTVRAALDALTDYGRPGLIRLAVLVDRGAPEFPIHADFVGFTPDTAPDRKIAVRFAADGELPEPGIYEMEWQ